MIVIQNYLQKLEFPLLTRMSWILVTQHWERNVCCMWKRKWTCETYSTSTPNETLTPVFIHSNTDQDHHAHFSVLNSYRIVCRCFSNWAPEIWNDLSTWHSADKQHHHLQCVSSLTIVHWILYLKDRYQNGHMGSEIFFRPHEERITWLFKSGQI